MWGSVFPTTAVLPGVPDGTHQLGGASHGSRRRRGSSVAAAGGRVPAGGALAAAGRRGHAPVRRRAYHRRRHISRVGGPTRRLGSRAPLARRHGRRAAAGQLLRQPGGGPLLRQPRRAAAPQRIDSARPPRCATCAGAHRRRRERCRRRRSRSRRPRRRGGWRAGVGARHPNRRLLFISLLIRLSSPPPSRTGSMGGRAGDAAAGCRQLGDALRCAPSPPCALGRLRPSPARPASASAAVNALPDAPHVQEHWEPSFLFCREGA